MTEAEVFAFGGIVRGLEQVFPKRLDEHERGQRIQAYAKAFRYFSLAQVQAGADAWMVKGKFFPKPAEWIDAMPRQRAHVVDIPLMTEGEARDYRRAEQLKWEDVPCVCQPCKAANVQDRPLRFVPDGAGRQMKDGERIVTAGHWAHGLELARWYRAKATYRDFVQSMKVGGLRSAALQIVRSTREPGEEG